MTLTLRHAVADDLAAVGALHHRSRAAAYGPFLPPEALAVQTPEAMGRYWAERWWYERETHLMTVAERDGRLVGFTHVGPADPDDPIVGLLCAIHLEPAEQGRGIGRELMAEALATMRRQGRVRAVLWVLRDNAPARRFYERGGWRPDGAEDDEPIGPVMVRTVRYARGVPGQNRS